MDISRVRAEAMEYALNNRSGGLVKLSAFEEILLQSLNGIIQNEKWRRVHEKIASLIRKGQVKEAVWPWSKSDKPKVAVEYKMPNPHPNSVLAPVPLSVTKAVAESAEKNYSNLYPTDVNTGYGLPDGVPDGGLNREPSSWWNPSAPNIVSLDGVSPQRYKMYPTITAAHELKHSDLPWGTHPQDEDIYWDDLSKDQWIRESLGTPDELLSEHVLRNQRAGEEDRAESGIFELFRKDPGLEAKLQGLGQASRADIEREASDHRDWYLNTSGELRSQHQLTNDQSTLLPLPTAFAEGQKFNRRRFAGRGLLINPITRERVSQHSPPEWADQDVEHHFPGLRDWFLDPATKQFVRGTDVLAERHAKQVRDMQDYYDPQGSVRQRSYQWNPTGNKYDIVAPQFMVQNKESADMQFDKDIPDERRWMFSPTNRIYNPKLPIITHSGYLNEARSHGYVPRPITKEESRFGQLNTGQSKDLNKQILLNTEGSRRTALMYSNPPTSSTAPNFQLPAVPTGPITDSQGNTVPTNAQTGYQGPPPSPPSTGLGGIHLFPNGNK